MRKGFKISEEDLKIIHGDDYNIFVEKIIPNCWCGKCHDPNFSTIINYEIFLDEDSDVLLSGFCKKCGSRVNRHLEVGEVEKYASNIELVRNKYAKGS